MSPPSQDGPSLRGGLTGLVVKRTPKPTKAMPSPMSFPNNAKTVAGADKDREVGVLRARMTPALRPRKRRRMRKMMKTKTYYCAYPGRSALRTKVVGGRVGQVRVPSIRSRPLSGRICAMVISTCIPQVCTRNCKDTNKRVFSILNINTHDSPQLQEPEQQFAWLTGF